MTVKEVTPEDIAEAITPDTPPVQEAPAVPVPSSQKRKHTAKTRPIFKSEKQRRREKYELYLADILRQALETGCDRLTIEVDIPQAYPGLTRKHLGARILAVLPQYERYGVVSTRRGAGFFHLVREAETIDEALRVIEEMRGTLPRGECLNIVGLTAGGQTVDGEFLLVADVPRS